LHQNKETGNIHSPALAHYGLLGDTRTADGGNDWLCAPTFDGEPQARGNHTHGPTTRLEQLVRWNSVLERLHRR
jgi:hypothetical protein